MASLLEARMRGSLRQIQLAFADPAFIEKIHGIPCILLLERSLRMQGSWYHLNLSSFCIHFKIQTLTLFFLFLISWEDTCSKCQEARQKQLKKEEKRTRTSLNPRQIPQTLQLIRADRRSANLRARQRGINPKQQYTQQETFHIEQLQHPHWELEGEFQFGEFESILCVPGVFFLAAREIKHDKGSSGCARVVCAQNRCDCETLQRLKSCTRSCYVRFCGGFHSCIQWCN